MRSSTRFVAVLAGMVALAGCDQTGAGPDGAAGDGEGTIELAEFPDRPYWGDTHLHTDNSVDAFGSGNRLGPEAALQFASGQEVVSSTGLKAKLARPLDFLVIADHSDGLGAMRRLYDAPRIALVARGDKTLLRWHDMMHEDPQTARKAVRELINAAATDTLPESMTDQKDQAKATKNIWTAQLAMLDRYNRPGKFSAIAGFEYSLMPDGNNLHRVVMFRDGSDRTKQVVPYPGQKTRPEGLWDYMDAYEKATGGQVLAIPHNSNLSNGMMFELTMSDGGAMTADYARRRARHEPVVEVTQIKGDSESHPFLSPNDEFASFGVRGWELGNLPLTQRADNSMRGGSYIREALKRGLTIENKLGVNPYAFGLIGSTDSHTSLSTGDEDNFFSKHSAAEPSFKDRTSTPIVLGPGEGRVGWQYLAGGYAAAWARGNTRAEIFDAFKRREVYATTGPRMILRVFGGFGFTKADWDGDWVRKGYKTGVPMGGVLADKGKAPAFLISALKDPDGANLDRVQIVKGWVDASGASHERVYDVVWSDMSKRRVVNGKVPAVGDTVDRKTATYTNSIGAAGLKAVWTDPDYRKGQDAFYYVRLLEIPTPRWTLFDAVRFGIKLPKEALDDVVAQERAYSSPIWVRKTRDTAS